MRLPCPFPPTPATNATAATTANGAKIAIARGARPAFAAMAILAALAAPRPSAGQAFQPPSSGFSPPGTFPYGAPLQGVRIVVSPGHGWQGGTTGGFQRSLYKWPLCGSCEGIIEDLFTAETCADHLVPLLRQAGARVHVAREQDRHGAEDLVDDGDARYLETGPWKAGTTAGLGFGGDYRALHAPDGGSAMWTLQVPAEGDWWVQARWAAGSNRCPDARFRVLHGGRTTDFVADQRADGTTWNYLARLHFPAGPATVLLTPPPAGDCYVIADAVRIGGGTDPDAGRPRWQMSAAEWLAFDDAQGVDGLGDVTVRPAWAEALGADLYLSLHANAGGGSPSNSGTSTYRYNCDTGARWEPLDPAVCDDPPGSAALQFAVQDRIVADLRQEWDPAWRNGGKLVADFGEVRVLADTPGILVESAFFDGYDTPTGGRYPDNRSLQDPRWRHVLARAIVRAVIAQVAPGTELPPEPPTHLVLRNTGQGGLRASWRPAEGARGYRVYAAVGGRGFDGGTVTEAPWLDLAGYPPGEPVFVRVTSLNRGGESRATGAVGAMARADGGPADLLIVDGYTRQDAWVREDANHRDYSVEHGLAVAAAGGWAFDGAQDDAVTDGDLALASYRAADWILGRESAEHETFSDAQQALVAAFLDGGGCLLASGTEIAWDLGGMGSATDQAFLADRLGATLEGDDAGVREIRGETGGPFADLPALHLDDGSGGTYDPKFPDVLRPEAGAQVVLRYANGGVAGVRRDGPAGRAMLFGFPVETVLGVADRADLVRRVLAACGSPTPPPVEPPPETADEGTGDAAGETVPDLAGETTAADVPPEAGEDVPAVPDEAQWLDDAAEPGEDTPETTGDLPVQADGAPADDLADTGDPAGPGDLSADRPGGDAGGDAGPGFADAATDLPEGAPAPHAAGGGCTAGGRGSGAGPAALAVLALSFLVLARMRRRGGVGVPLRA